jgi:NAD(P)-dependent dehydrogenase (short-subunit alcohol dehydrogenase family)
VGQVVVVTGASAGVGRATARAFAERGASVALLARGRAGLDAAAREVEAAGGRALPIPVDVADAAAVERAADRVEEELGPIDVWVNSAMAAILAEVGQTEPEEFRRVIEVTLLGSVHGTMAALRRMGPRDRGTIVQVGSALAHRGIPLQASYCAAKHGLQGFFESLRTELLHQGSAIRYTMVQLPGLNTPQFTWVRVRGLARTPRPVAPVYAPEVAARAIVWAAEHGRREVWVGGATVATILGNRLVPWFVDRYLARSTYQGQQTDQPIPADRRDYLFEALDDEEDRGARGPFDAEAKARSAQLWLRTHRLAAWGSALAGLVAATGGVARSRRG